MSERTDHVGKYAGLYRPPSTENDNCSVTFGCKEQDNLEWEVVPSSLSKEADIAGHTGQPVSSANRPRHSAHTQKSKDNQMRWRSQLDDGDAKEVLDEDKFLMAEEDRNVVVWIKKGIDTKTL